MSDRNAHRPGYQKTRVGWIPDDWEVKKFKDVAQVNPRKPRDILENMMVGFVPMANVSEAGKLMEYEIVPCQDVNSGYTYFEEGDILVAKITPSFENGKGCLVGNLPNGIGFGSTEFHVLRCKNIDSQFMFYHTRSYPFRVKGGLNMTGTAGQKRVPTDYLESYRIPVPTVQEQRAIADILSTWDRAIEQTRALIDAKQRLKRGLMQQLLTGRLRFPGFGPPAREKGELPAGWKVKRLKDMAEIIVSNVDKKAKKSEKPVLLCNYMDVYENYYISSEIDFMQATASEREVKKFRLNINDIVITKDSETSEDIAKPSIVLENVDRLLCGYHLAILRTKNSSIDAKFLAYMLGYGRTHHYFVSHANGVTRFGLTIPVIEKAKIPLPPADEQRKIAELLFGIEEEIDLLIQSIDFYKHQKKGLMQKLLSGQVRSHFLS